MVEQLQLSLFDYQNECLPSQTETKNASNLKWSHSKRNALEQCSKRYYYNYYGSNSKTAKEEPLKEKLAVLKKRTNRHITAGLVLHNLIKETINKLQQGEEVSLEELLKLAKKRYRNQIGYFQRWRKKSIEVYYGIENADELIAETEAKLLRAIANLIQSSTFEVFRLFFSQTQSIVEKSLSIKENNLKLGGKLDFAYTEGDRLAIVDWKLGGNVGSSDTLQLISYAFLASEKLGYAPEKIDLHQAHLASNFISSFEIGKTEVFRAKNLILQDLEMMNQVHDYGQRGVSLAFPPCGKPRICQLCPFQEVCPQE